MSTILTNTLKTLALGLVLAAAVHSAQAAGTPHTFVSAGAGGSDGNPCTRAQPCATFQDALFLTAPGGIITALDAGDYGTVSISQPVTLDGTGTQASIVTASSPAITISVSQGSVILRHLSLTGMTGQSGSHYGIQITSGALVVDDCKISGFSTAGISVGGSASGVVKNTAITGCFFGVSANSTGLFSLRTVTLQGNAYGMYVFSGQTDISHSVITQSSNAGVEASNNGTTLSVSDCMISGNGTGVGAGDNSVIRLTGCDLFNNTTGIDTATGLGSVPAIVSTAGNNHKAGNPTPGAPTPGKIIVTQ